MIRIITDSTAGFSDKEISDLNIDVIPLYIVTNSSKYKDLNSNTFLSLVDEFPKTAEPTPADILEYFNFYPNDYIIFICTSKQISNTYISANIAKDLSKNKNIFIIDSKTLSTGLKSIVEFAVYLRNNNYSFDTIISKIEEIKKHSVTIAIINSFKYLQKSNKVSNLSALTGNLFNIKPIFIVKSSIIQPYKKINGTNKLYSFLENIPNRFNINKDFPIYLSTHSELKICENIKENFSKKYITSTISELPSVIMCHTGPECIVCSLFSKDKIFN